MQQWESFYIVKETETSSIIDKKNVKRKAVLKKQRDAIITKEELKLEKEIGEQELILKTPEHRKTTQGECLQPCEKLKRNKTVLFKWKILIGIYTQN